MGREKDGFRDNWELLDKRFPGKDMLNIKDVMEFTGQSRNTVIKKIRFSPLKLISKTDLARQICTG